MTAHELLLAMDDNRNQIINFFANGYVSLTNANQATKQVNQMLEEIERTAFWCMV